MTEFKDHFSGVAAGYSTSRPVYPIELVERLAGVADARDLAWDAGCGSGQLSARLAESFARVVATDASPQQIAQARPRPGVEYRVASAEASGLAARSADLCVAAQAAHWFDLPRYYEEVRRVAKPGGVIALVTYARPTLDDGVEPAFERIVALLAPWWPPERGPVDELYANVPFPFDEIRLPRTVMAARWELAHLTGYVETWSATQAFVQAKGRVTLDGLMRDLGDAWGSPERPRVVTWPLGTRVGRVGRPLSGAG